MQEVALFCLVALVVHCVLPTFDSKHTPLRLEQHCPEQVMKLSAENEAEAQLSESGQHNPMYEHLIKKSFQCLSASCLAARALLP